MTWEIRTGDCIAGLRGVRGARLIFADPPYNQGIDYGQGAQADRLTDREYLRWCARWMKACKASLTDDGSLWVLISDEYAAEMAVILKSVGLHRRSWVKWYETFGVACQRKFNRCTRHLLHCVVDPKRFVFNRAAVSRPSDRQVKYRDKRANPAGKVWDDLWRIPRLAGTHKERLKGFPTQLPLALLRPIVGCASNPGDLVVDPFCGSGTTGHAALELGRDFIGIELSQQYAELARRRLVEVK